MRYKFLHVVPSGDNSHAVFPDRPEQLAHVVSKSLVAEKRRQFAATRRSRVPHANDARLPEGTIERERQEMSGIAFGRTRSRSLLGSLNDFSLMARMHFVTRRTDPLDRIARDLAETPLILPSDVPAWGQLDMRRACTHASRMARMVQIRNVPDALHRKLKVRAADSGQTLSDYLLAELERVAARPTRNEMLTRLHSRRRVTLKTAASTVIREERESA
jgi:plasmid stability protein